MACHIESMILCFIFKQFKNNILAFTFALPPLEILRLLSGLVFQQNEGMGKGLNYRE